MSSDLEFRQAAVQRAEAFELPPYWHRGLPAFDGYRMSVKPEEGSLTDTMLSVPASQSLRGKNQYWIGIADIGLLCDEKAILGDAIFNARAHRAAKSQVLPKVLCNKLSLVPSDDQRRPGLAIEVGRLHNGSPRFGFEHASLVSRCLRIPDSAQEFSEHPNDYPEFNVASRVALKLAEVYTPERRQTLATPPGLRMKAAVANVAGALAAQFALKNNIPVIVRMPKGDYVSLADQTASQPACAPVAGPFDRPVSLVNVCNLSTALRHGEPLFSQEEISGIARYLSS